MTTATAIRPLLSDVAKLTLPLRMVGKEWLRSRGFASYAQDAYKVQTVALCLQQPDGFDVSLLANFQPSVVNARVRPFRQLLKLGLLTQVSPDVYKLKDLPALDGYYLADKEARFVHPEDVKKGGRRATFRVVCVETARGGDVVVFGKTRVADESRVLSRPKMSDAFRRYVQLSRDLGTVG